MIYTSNYRSVKSPEFNPISISLDRGKDAGFNGDYIECLAPKLSFFKAYKRNKGVLSDEENDRFYIEEYFKQVLSLLDPSEIYEMLNDRVMLCYEDNMEFCHRHVVSAWLELFLDIDVFEVAENNGKLKICDKPNRIKKTLEEVIRSDMVMYGFNSIRAAYLYGLSLQTDNSYLSKLLLFTANEVEDNYIIKVKKHKK